MIGNRSIKLASAVVTLKNLAFNLEKFGCIMFLCTNRTKKSMHGSCTDYMVADTMLEGLSNTSSLPDRSKNFSLQNNPTISATENHLRSPYSLEK